MRTPQVLQQCLGESLDAIRTLRLNPVLTGVSVMFALTITADEWLRLWLQHDPAVLAGVDSATVGLSVTDPVLQPGSAGLAISKACGRCGDRSAAAPIAIRLAVGRPYSR